MLTNNQKPRLLLLRKAFIMPVILTTAIAVGCSKSKNASQQSSSTAATDQVKTAVTVEPEKGAVKMVEPVIPGIQNQPLDSDPGREKIITVHSGANQKSTDNRFKVSFENGGPVISTAK